MGGGGGAGGRSVSGSGAGGAGGAVGAAADDAGADDAPPSRERLPLAAALKRPLGESFLWCAFRVISIGQVSG